jgi:hypothetical protein
MKKLWLILALASLAGCYYPAYTVRRSAPVDPPVSKEEVERLASAGVSEGVMTELVEKRGAAALSTDDLVALKKSGVPDAVVQKMIANKREAASNAVVEEVYPYPNSYYYDYPYYGSFSYGFGWGWGGYYRPYPRYGVGVRVYR